MTIDRRIAGADTAAALVALCISCSGAETEEPEPFIDSGRDDASSVDVDGDSGAGCEDHEGDSMADAIAMSTGACRSQAAVGAKLSTTDVDYYTFRATPAANCDYAAQGRLGGAWAPAELCFFAECESGGTATCAAGTPSSEEPKRMRRVHSIVIVLNAPS